ncbi:SMEK domain-containing protein [Aeromonas bestiarum]|uniref:SMEK domain-containing protein n=1 Tax=Aeromonas bestiarum TaxID=105751 RepID=A0AAW7HZE7_9GAMM|nr:SMEK domain-containing protein [Aeromonas bestiarum]MDM5140437.1 SMEK domain-containing protein [Aeromonas bestiarum]
MFTTAKKFEEILTCLSILRYIFKSKGKRGLFDINKQAESFFCEILNSTYQWRLENLNNSKSNYPAIDLGDRDNRICVQITSENTSSKIHETIAKFIKHDLHKEYSRLIIFVLTDIKNYTTEFDTQDKFNFDKSSDIIDVDMLLNDIEDLANDTISKIHGFVTSELSQLRSLLADKNSLLSKVDSTTVTFPDNITKFLEYHNFDKSDYTDEYKGIRTLSEQINNLTKASREYLFALVFRGIIDNNYLSQNFYALPEDIKSYLNIPRQDLLGHYNILDKAGLVTYEDDNNLKRLEICAPSPHGNNYLSQLKEFTNNDHDMLHKIIVDCDYTSLSDNNT